MPNWSQILGGILIAAVTASITVYATQKVHADRLDQLDRRTTALETHLMNVVAQQARQAERNRIEDADTQRLLLNRGFATE